MRQLVFIHGRAQEFKDASALKAEWIGAWEKGLAKSGLTLPLPESEIRFPYYGQTLHDLVEGVPADEMARVIVRGDDSSVEQEAFCQELLREVCTRFGISDSQLRELTDDDTIEKGVLNWKWVQTVLKGIDTYVPGGSSGSVALFTNDVYEYLDNAGFAGIIDQGVRSAFDPALETVVVSHSLGTVVAQNVLNQYGTSDGWKIPLHVTVGSPLAVTVIKQRLAPIKHPACVGEWFNARDPNDVVALYPLDAGHYPVTPSIENKSDVDNHTDNQHGIVGYLDDAVVARRIHDALGA